MTNKIRIGLGIVVVAVLVGLWRGCTKDHIQPVAFNVPLAPNTAAQVVVQKRHIAVRTEKETKGSYVPQGGQATVLIGKDRTVDLRVREAGLTLQPAAGAMFGEKVRGGIGLQLAYWNRFELYAGAAFPYPVGWAGLGYRLDAFDMLSNTSVFVGVDTQKFVNVGLLVHF